MGSQRENNLGTTDFWGGGWVIWELRISGRRGGVTVRVEVQMPREIENRCFQQIWEAIFGNFPELGGLLASGFHSTI